MEIKFIGQGLDPESEHTAGNVIINSLNDIAYTSFNAFVAFVSTGGLKNILDQLNAFIEREGKIRLYVGVDLNATSKEVLEQLLALGIETYVIYSPNNIIYHPKIYTFEGGEVSRAIVGSTNLTESGLFQNIEAAVCVDFQKEDEMGAEFISDIYDHFNSIINVKHPSCCRLDQEVLDILIESKVVMPEAAVRAKANKIKKEFEQKDAKADVRLKQLFGKVKPKRPPKGYKKSVTKKDLVVEKGHVEVEVADQIIDLSTGAMWIETGRMTGGSRNILDLSKHGKLDGIDKFGSVSFFGLDPEAADTRKDITISFGGKSYIGNTIFYTPGNSNWRFRMNGRTEEGEKLTTFAKPNLGEHGGFQYSILIFTILEDDLYKLEVVDQGELSGLVDNSSIWAKGGHGNGRAYGLIR
ncbi:phospholipase D-like domain-containing protein [Mucilaginibacter terrae]|uniref:phospholipase D-like domain-containing protein n=1 Tax=Mucilaginibacter terrae TaxID=1955052 RepID=UPI003633B31A